MSFCHETEGKTQDVAPLNSQNPSGSVENAFLRLSSRLYQCGCVAKVAPSWELLLADEGGPGLPKSGASNGFSSQLEPYRQSTAMVSAPQGPQDLMSNKAGTIGWQCCAETRQRSCQQRSSRSSEVTRLGQRSTIADTLNRHSFEHPTSRDTSRQAQPDTGLDMPAAD